MVKKILVYFCFVLLFEVERLIFLNYHSDIYSVYSTLDWVQAMWYGLPHDLTCAGYVMALPFLASVPYVWIKGNWHRNFMRWYLRIILIPVLLIFFVDLELYTHWGFRLDSTPLIYLLDNPLESIRQAPIWAMLLFPVILAGIWWVLQRIFLSLYPARKHGTPSRMAPLGRRYLQSLASILLCGLVFLAIRGGVTTSTMNVGRVYFSTEMPLNHAATNPFFSFFYSLGKTKDFSKQYRFMSSAEVEAAFAEMDAEALANVRSHILQNDSLVADSAFALLTTDRPNILLILLESFSGGICSALYPEADPNIMPHVNRYYQEGVGFTNFYANSFRTDRGCAAILASYPGQTDYSVMKNQLKCNNLQYLSKRLGEEGYDLQFIHGGDVNFTNMKGFLRAGGITNVIGDVDFPIKDRMSKWGVPDHLMFEYLQKQIMAECATQQVDSAGRLVSAPFFKTFLTLSSHEPFDVDYHHFDDPYINSVAYTDSCMGAFIDQLRQSPYWDNLLIIGVPDHCFAKCPPTVQNHEPLRYHIPMFWMGGAVARPCIVDTYGSQTDITATLLAQMGVRYDDFNFSRDLLCDTIPHFAFYAFSDGFGLINDSISYVQDNASDGRPLSGSNDPAGKAEKWGKAYLQRLYDDLSRR